MTERCPHCIINKLEKKTRIKLSEDFKVGFQLGALFYPELVKRRMKDE